MDPKLIEWLASVKDDPLAFVLGAFPWEEPDGALAEFDGPLVWQREILEAIKLGLLDPSEAIQIAPPRATESANQPSSP